jgi:hypothetical protein
VTLSKVLNGRLYGDDCSKSQLGKNKRRGEHTRIVDEEEFLFDVLEPGTEMKTASESGGLQRGQYHAEI